MSASSTGRTITEPAREIDVCREADVVVVGGGPGGIGSALAAARSGADTVAVFANNDTGEISARHPNVCIPYRSLVPRKIDGLLVACRAFSSEYGFNEHFNLIPHCIALGQAAGAAAVLAVKDGIQPRAVDCGKLQESLLRQGALLPDKIAGNKA
jgi:hypothetical protein